MSPINEAAERELARLAAAHYGLPETDIPALMAFERHCAEQKKILGMPGLAAVPCFIAGFHAGQATRASLPPASGEVRGWVVESSHDTDFTNEAEIADYWRRKGRNVEALYAQSTPEMQASHGAAGADGKEE